MPTTKRAFRIPRPAVATAGTRPSKRRRIDDGKPHDSPASPTHIVPLRDHLSSLSDELLLRILSYLPLSHLLGLSPVSHRFNRLSSDSQLWRQLYYMHFVLPRAIRIPGFRPNAGPSDSPASNRTVIRHCGADLRRYKEQGGHGVDWKRQYKLRHNWSRGKCAVEELEVGGPPITLRPARKQTLAKVVEGVAITADAEAGLRTWDLKTKKLLAQTELRNAVPTCMAVDEQDGVAGRLEVALGFLDGCFGIWALDTAGSRITERYRHSGSMNGKLMSVAYAFPYIMTATESVRVSIYAFDVEVSRETSEENGIREGPAVLGETLSESPRKSRVDERTQSTSSKSARMTKVSTFPPPYLMTSLKSHSSKSPLALCIRKMTTSTIAAIAYTLPTREGWTIGVQELHITASPPHLKAPPEVSESRLAYAAPTVTGRSRDTPPGSTSSDTDDNPAAEDEYGPMALCYTHPYLLVTLPDNTLVLYLCTTDATSLSISRGIRLWGHTSGIGDAEITSRGKAVSVSCRGDEVRVWELEGRVGGRSVEIRPNAGGEGGARDVSGLEGDVWDDRRSWVGFDDEMVIVLKEAKSGRESLIVYDFS